MTRPTLASHETEIQVIKAQNASRDKHIEELTATIKSMDAKLTELVALKNKGTGAAWFVGIIWASGILGGITTLYHWIFDK
jgi:hypothetical protein